MPQTLGRLRTRPVVVYPTPELGWRAVLEASFDKLGGERVYGSERFIRLLTGPLFDELEPLD